MNFKLLKRILCLVLVFSVIAVAFSASFGVSASKESDLREEISDLEDQSKKLEAEIAKLKKDKAQQATIKAAIDKKIAVTQQEINAYNSKITQLKNDIAASEAKIADKNAEIAETKENFKKRIRSMYLSNSTNYVQLLLSAESFADFLTLSELTQSMSAQDKIVIDKIVETIAEIQVEIENNKKRQEEQAAAKAVLDKKKAELDAEVAEVNKIIADINKDTSKLNSQNATIENQIKQKENYLYELLYGENLYDGAFDGALLWPVPGYTYVSAGWDSNDPVHQGNHSGIDIAGSGISGKKVVAAATGTVSRIDNYCTHNYRKYSSCGCGGGYGNNIRVDHGKYGNYYYRTIYAHLTKVAGDMYVGKHVSRGTTVGYVGCTGWSTGPHLHFGVARNSKANTAYNSWVNPYMFKFVYR